MKRRNIPAAAGLCATLLLAAPASAGDEAARPQRDPDIAVQEEFSTAAANGNAESWKLFIARHPGHPLAEEARKRLRALPR